MEWVKEDDIPPVVGTTSASKTMVVFNKYFHRVNGSLHGVPAIRQLVNLSTDSASWDTTNREALILNALHVAKQECLSIDRTVLRAIYLNVFNSVAVVVPSYFLMVDLTSFVHEADKTFTVNQFHSVLCFLNSFLSKFRFVSLMISRLLCVFSTLLNKNWSDYCSIRRKAVSNR